MTVIGFNDLISLKKSAGRPEILMIFNNCTLSMGITMTKGIEDEAKQVWEKSWEGHERAQKLRMARFPLVEKIIWLEQAQEMLLNAPKRGERIQESEKRI